MAINYEFQEMMSFSRETVLQLHLDIFNHSTKIKIEVFVKYSDI